MSNQPNAFRCNSLTEAVASSAALALTLAQAKHYFSPPLQVEFSPPLSQQISFDGSRQPLNTKQ